MEFDVGGGGGGDIIIIIIIIIIISSSSKKTEMAGHVARLGRGEVHTGLYWGNLREGDHLEDPGVDGRIILKWIFERLDGGHELDQSGSG
jgi:hypothetical protein